MKSWGLILAGGESKRMGSDKALIQWRDKALISHTVEALTGAGMMSILVAIPDGGARFSEVMDSVGEIGVQSSDDGRFKGPIAGLAGAIPSLLNRGVDWVQLSPCDTPSLSSEVYLMLMDLATQVGCSVVPVDATGPQWLHALVKVNGLSEAIDNAAENGDWGRAIHRLLEDIEWHPLDAESLGELASGFHNVNSPADLDSLS